MSLLVSQHTLTTAQVNIFDGANITSALGDSLPSLETSGTSQLQTNRVINAWGSVYVSHYDGIYRLQEGSREGEWSKLSADGGLTFTGLTGAGTAQSYGPYFIVIDNEPYIFGVYWLGTGQSHRIWKINLLKDYSDPTRNTISATLTGGNTWEGVTRNSALFNGLLWAFPKATNPAQFQSFDPVSMTSAIYSTATYGQEASINVFKNRLFYIGVETSTTPDYVRLYEQTAAGPSLRLNLDLNNPGGQTTRFGLLFDDEVNMYALYLGGTGGNGWKLTELIYDASTPSTPFTVGDSLTNIVLPTGFRSGTYTTGRWAVYKNQNTNGTRDIYLYYASAYNSTWAQYLWRGKTQELLLLDSGGTATLALPSNSYGGGDRTFDLGYPTITIYKRERSLIGQKVTYRVFLPQMGNPVSLDSLTVKFYYTNEHGIPLTQATLTGSATGGSSVRSGNSIVDVTADGTTDYTAILYPNGFNDNDKIGIMALVT